MARTKQTPIEKKEKPALLNDSKPTSILENNFYTAVKKLETRLTLQHENHHLRSGWKQHVVCRLPSH